MNLNKLEFSKKMIIIDYVITIILMICSLFNSNMVTIVIAWIAQLAISTGFYYWKAKNENRMKVPAEIIKSLKNDLNVDLDLTQIITSLIMKD